MTDILPALLDIPTDRIDALALPRDRHADDAEAFGELMSSILIEGLRQPVELFLIESPGPGAPDYGLISGFRRLAAVRALGQPTIPAFIRHPASIPAAIAAMVSENEARSQVSPWEKARLIVTCLERDLFPNADAALDGLFPMLSRQKRSRMRGHVLVVETFGDAFTDPRHLTVARLDRLAAALRSGWEDLLLAALPAARNASPDSQWSALAPLLDEALAPETTAPPGAQGAPRRMLKLPQGLVIRREKTRTGWILRFSGPEARSPGLIDDVFELVEGMLGRP